MEEYTQTDRLYKVKCDGLNKDQLLMQSFSGVERISEPYSYSIHLMGQGDPVDPKKVLGKELTIEIETAGGPRFITGRVRRFGLTGRQRPFDLYHAEIVPWLWFLSLRQDCRIFQNKNVQKIIEEILDEQPGDRSYRFDLQKQYPDRTYCVQYRESALDFVSRLLEHEGIHYYVEHNDGKHTIVFSDNSTAAKACAPQSEIRLAEQAGPWQEEDVVLDALLETTVHTGKVALTDYDFEKPAAQLEMDSRTLSKIPDLDKFEVFDYPGHYTDSGAGKKVVDRRMEEREVFETVLRGSSNAKSFQTGRKFKLQKHFDPSADGEYLLVEVHHSGQAWSGDEAEYTNGFLAIPVSVKYRPSRSTPRPVVSGAQTAVVVGPSGEEIHTDKFGRVKVQFHWDRVGNRDDKSSCWVRVSSAWAGKRWGFIQLPRIGQEVIISFLEGDPDQPLVTGRLYNGQQEHPYSLPGNQTQSGVKSRTSKNGGEDNYNEFRFEDLKDEEEILLHAEKDLTVEVENYEDRTIDGKRTTVIKGKGKEGQENPSDTLTLEDGDQRTTLKKGNQILNIKQGDQTVTIDMGNQTIKIKKGKISIEAMQSIELKVGSSKLKLDPSGIKMEGAQIGIKGTAKAEITAPMVKVDASGMLELKGGGMIKAQGGMVMIN